MTIQQKKQIRDALIRYVGKFESQAQASVSLEGISPTAISQVKNNNWDLLSDQLWYRMARQVGFYVPEWQSADTSTSLLLRILFGDAQRYNMIYGIAIAPGLGKTFTARTYARGHAQAMCISCHADFNRRSFIVALLQAAGLEPAGPVPVMMQQFTEYFSGLDEPILLLDDAHTLKDRVLHFVVMLANGLTGKAGVVLLGTDTLRSRIVEGVRTGRTGFGEIFNCIGRRFITLACLAPNDIALVCNANGLFDEDIIRAIAADSEGSLHHTTRLIQEYHDMKAAA